MEHDERPLPIDPKMLGDYVSDCGGRSGITAHTDTEGYGLSRLRKGSSLQGN